MVTGPKLMRKYQIAQVVKRWIEEVRNYPGSNLCAVLCGTSSGLGSVLERAVSLASRISHSLFDCVAVEQTLPLRPARQLHPYVTHSRTAARESQIMRAKDIKKEHFKTIQAPKLPPSPPPPPQKKKTKKKKKHTKSKKKSHITHTHTTSTNKSKKCLCFIDCLIQAVFDQVWPHVQLVEQVKSPLFSAEFQWAWGFITSPTCRFQHQTKEWSQTKAFLITCMITESR